MVAVLVNKRILILAPYYLYVGLFFTLWITVIPTTLQFTMVKDSFASIIAYHCIYSGTVQKPIRADATWYLIYRRDNF